VSGRLRVDAAALRAQQPAIATLAELLDGTVTRLGTALDREGPCWGFDEPGRAFGDTYGPAARQVRTALGHAVERLHELRTAVGLLAGAAEVADEQARQRLG
jgi:hypothetical protein